MIVVASTANKRDEIDMFSLMTPGKVQKNSDWFPLFKRNCKKILITGEKWYSLVKIRGSLSEISNKNIDEIKIGGVRCPIHEIKDVCKMGNKNVVDLVVALDPTCVKKKEDFWECEISFPMGFTPMCYTSKNSTVQYIAVLFQELGIIAVDISPVSYTLLWDIEEPCTVTMNSKRIANRQFHKLEILNTKPSTKYIIRVSSETSNKFVDITVQTPEMNVSTMALFYKSRKKNGDFYDLVGVNSETVKYLRTKNLLKSGHKVHITPTDSKESTLASVVVSGDTVKLSKGENMYVIPDFYSESEQFICLEDDTRESSHVIEFDKSESYVKYLDKVYPHGSKFHVNSQLISVVSGSIILVVTEDTDPALFPGGDAYASQILTSGDLVIRDLIMRSSQQVTEKLSGETTYGKNSFFIHDPTAGTTKEVSRISHGLDDAGEVGSVSIDLLYTDSLLAESIVNTLVTQPSSTVITSREDTETTATTFDSGGLSFDNDNAAIYFGADKDFRIQYTDVSGLDPAMLKIESWSGTEYVTRFLITNESP